MGYSLNQIIPALESIGASAAHIRSAIDQLNCTLAELDEVEVKGRQKVDTLLGCMMAIEVIIGKGGDHG